MAENNQYFLFMVTQDIAHHIGSNAQEINSKIENLIGENLEHCYTIEHNRCTRDVWNIQEKKYEKEYKNSHAHSVIKVKRKRTISSIAETLGIEEQYVEKPKTKGPKAESVMLAYLIHACQPSKVPYEPSEVVSSSSATPYEEVWAKNKKEWDLWLSKARNKQAEITVDEILEKIESEEIVDKNQILLTDEYYRCYSRNSKKIDNALEIASQRRQARGVQKIKDGNLKQVIFITGEPRKGKSYLTDQIAQNLAKEKGWLVGEGAVSNCFDDYHGEEIFVLDDARGSSMKAEEWTRFLDPRKANRGSARFRNKVMSPQIIVFNCFKDVDEFFFFTKGLGKNDKSEALDQFIGRILIRLVVHGPNDIDVSLSHERPSTRAIEFTNSYGENERHVVETEHSFVTICEHQTNENVVALVAAMVCANQHAGRVTDAMLDAVAKLQIPYNNVLEEDEKILLEEKSSIEEQEAIEQEQAKQKKMEEKKQIEDTYLNWILCHYTLEEIKEMQEKVQKSVDEMFSV